MEAFILEFGTDHLYSSDPFNEMDPDTDDPNYISEVGEAIFDTMKAGDADAVWVMQGWMFYFAQDYWKLPQAKALLTSVPQGDMYEQMVLCFTNVRIYDSNFFFLSLEYNQNNLTLAV